MCHFNIEALDGICGSSDQLRESESSKSWNNSLSSSEYDSEEEESDEDELYEVVHDSNNRKMSKKRAERISEENFNEPQLARNTSTDMSIADRIRLKSQKNNQTERRTSRSSLDSDTSRLSIDIPSLRIHICVSVNLLPQFFDRSCF